MQQFVYGPAMMLASLSSRTEDKALSLHIVTCNGAGCYALLHFAAGAGVWDPTSCHALSELEANVQNDGQVLKRCPQQSRNPAPAVAQPSPAAEVPSARRAAHCAKVLVMARRRSSEVAPVAGAAQCHHYLFKVIAMARRRGSDATLVVGAAKRCHYYLFKVLAMARR